MEQQTPEPQFDKSTWGPGPWQDEPDRLDFEHAGFACIVLRVRESGHLCGYVGVPNGHPLYGVAYSAESEALRAQLERRKEQPIGEQPGMGLMIQMLGGELRATPDAALNVHGGITYSEKCAGRVCHVPRDGMPADVWWFGFDCAHAGDFSPGMTRFRWQYGLSSAGGTYRTVEFVQDECRSLAEQLREIGQ